jgi:hypothetical protein
MNRLAPLRVLALLLAVVSLVLPSVSSASLRLAPAASDKATKPASSPSTEPAATAAKPEPAATAAKSEPAVADEAGDLTAQREAAIAERTATPTADTYHREAELAERAGDWSAAITAYQGELARLGKDDAARARAQQGLSRVRERARGVVADEGKSSHREQLDAAWAQPESKPAPSKPQPLAERPTKDDRIVKKWYFWVTIGAIVASAAAVNGIAIKASRDDKPDSLDRRAVFGVGTGALRF